MTPPRVLLLLVIISSSLASKTALAEPRRVTPVDGQPFPAELVAASSDGILTFNAQAKERQRAAAELVTWGVPIEATRAQLVLADGSLLVGDVLSVSDDKLLLETRHLNQLPLSLDTLAGILLQPPADAVRRDRLSARLLAMETTGLAAADNAETDQLILQNGDELAGTLLGMTENTLTLNTAAGDVEIDRATVAAIRFSPAVRATAPTERGTALVGLLDGTLLIAEKWSAEKEVLTLNLPGQAQWTGDSAAVCFVQPLNGKVKYLSDLPAESFLHLPYLSLAWPYQKDRSVGGSRLRGGGRLYAKGIGLHSTSRLTYKVPKTASRFQALAAIDDQAGMRGSVVFRVFLDGKEAFKSGPVRGGDLPLPIDLELGGARQLSLIVDFGERGDEMDHANWLDARLVE